MSWDVHTELDSVAVNYSETPIQRSAKGLGKCVRYSRVRCIRVLFYTFYCNWAEAEYRLFTVVFVILGCVKRAVFHCNENFKFNKIFPFEAYLSASILTGIYKFTVKLFFLPFWALNVVNKASSLRVPQIIITAFTTSKYFCTSLRKPECVREIIDFVIYNNIIRTREHAFDLQRGLITLLLREKDRLIQLLCFVYVVVFCYSLPLHYTRYDAWFSVNVLT